MRKYLLAALVALPCAVLATPASAQPFSGVWLGQAGSLGLDLSVFVTGGMGTFQSTNPSTITNGNVGFAAGVRQNGTSDGQVTGTLYYQDSASLTGIGNYNKNGTFTQTSLAQALTDVTTAANLSAALSPDQTINGDVGGSALTITASGPQTVVNINGNINISNSSHNLTISGTASQYVIINVSKNITLTNGSITITGGIDSSHVLFNLTGHNAQVTFQTSTSEIGTYLAPFATDTITTHGNTVDGALIGYNVSMTSGTQLQGDGFTPEPASLSLLGLSAGPLLLRRRRA